MADEAAIPRDDAPPPHVPSGPFARIIGAMNAVGTLWIIGLMVLINADIIGRSFVNRPIAGVAELVTFSIVGIVFLQLAHTLRSGSMTRSDVLLNLLERRAPRVRFMVLALFHLIGGLLLALVAWKYAPSLAAAWQHPERNFMGNPGFFTVPQWPLYALVLLGIIATAIQFLLLAWSDVHAARRLSR
ncbi:TRAP transporter small permease subunit [Oryzicola mucosus]|uniref:TRAP transporter small permease protein n=1 Tax=Oryzicola mucosus TaxID=2767425 RepID=A0A8J6U9I2_9HYPH|nr:TRAP transporter small permease [Oryzicola mucosus]MBD0417312.1 TRAP transporter small permease [Oryzicola mucosus]